MKDVYLIGNAHIDPVWLWRKGEGMAEVLSTYRSALDRMNEFPDYVFTSACAYYYQFVADVDADMLAEIRKRVNEGRWVIAGGTWVQTDMNIPGSEAFARQELYSQRCFKKLLGKYASTGYCVDSFGHNGMTPQMLSQGRMQNYIFMRPGENENPALKDLFNWRSPDGSEVLTYRVNCGYGDDHFRAQDIDEYQGMSSTCIKAHELNKRARKTACPQIVFYGVGNHGGGPTIKELASIAPLLAENKNVCYAGADELFDDVRAALKQGGRLHAGKDSLAAVDNSVEGYKIPEWTHDLQHHASGCYTANTRIKSLNRRAENALTEAEKYALCASLLVGAPDMRSEIERAWKKVMFNQFHDILAGCTLKSAAQDAEIEFNAAIDAAEETILYSLQRWARRINTIPAWGGKCTPPQKHGWLRWQADAAVDNCTRKLGDLPMGVGAPVIIFNPHAFPLHTNIRLSALAGCVRDSEGKPVMVQTVRGEQTNVDDKYVALINADVPALGWAIYYIYGEDIVGEEEAAACPANPVSVEKIGDGSGVVLDNGILRAEFDGKTGLLSRLVEINTGNVIAKDAARAIFIDDSGCDTWAHGVFKFDKLAGEFEAVSVDVIEDGTLRACVRVTAKLGESTLEQTFTLDADADTLACHAKLTLNDRLRLCKLSFPTGLEAPKAYTSMPGGFIEKAADGREQPCQSWIAEAQDGRGLAVLNSGRYGASFEGGEIRMAIARSAIFADHYGRRDDRLEYMDIGETEFDYALTSFTGENAAHVSACAELLNTPPRQLMEGQHAGKLGVCCSGIAIDADNVTLQALKRAENGRGYIVRLRETAGRACRAHVDIKLLGAEFDAEFTPMRILSMYIEDGVARVTDFVEPD